MIRLAALLTVVVACGDTAPIGDCDSDLTGVWSTPSGRWMLLDHGKTIEGYPLFDDSVDGGAPRFVSVARDGRKLDGALERRYMLREHECLAHAPLHVTGCKGSALQVVRGDVAAPLSFVPCAWPQQAPTRVETWRRN